MSRERHGMTGHPLHRTWRGMRDRCLNPNNPYYSYYGERGITICNRWDNFANFVKDMGDRPEGMTLDRINPDGNYEPSNCRWATKNVQQRNQRMNTRNKSGYTGVHFDKAKNKWLASIAVNHKTIFLGRYDTIEEAITARQQGEKDHWS